MSQTTWEPTRGAILRYAQEYGGQRLHLVEAFADQTVTTVALCGRSCLKRGRWRMTINWPLGAACKRCRRVVRAYNRRVSS